MRIPALALLVSLCGVLAGVAVGETAAPLTCAELRSLGRERAQERLPVRLRGVVMLVLPNQAFVIQDDTDAIYVSWNGLSFDAAIGPGDRLEILGETAAGGFAPLIKAREVRRLSRGERPPARRTTLGELLTGRMDCHRVLVRGVARRFHVGRDNSSGTRMEIAAPGGVFSIFVPGLPAESAAALVDAELEIDGVCFSFFNPRGELTGINLRTLDSAALSVLRPAPADPFAVPEISPLGMVPFSRDGPSLHRTRLTGTVTLCRPGELVFVQIGARGFRIHPAGAERFEPGDQVEASGFLEVRSGFGVMKEALLRRRGTGVLPEPLPVTRAAIMAHHPGLAPRLNAEDHDARLVRLIGEFTGISRLPGDDVRLYLEQDGQTVVTTLPAATAESSLGWLKIGAIVEVTGICALSLASTWPDLEQPVVEDFTLVLQSTASIRMVRQASWWTVSRLRVLLSVTAGALLLAVGAVLLLRRVVAARTRQLTSAIVARQEQERVAHDAEVAFAAALRERERLAADLHDTIEQSLTGVALQLDAAQRAPEGERAARNLGLAAQMLTRSREDVRRSVWNLRAQALDGRLLRAAVCEIGGSLLDGTGLVLSVGGKGGEEPLPDFIAGNLLMLAKEGVTNALKHSAGTRLDIEVDYGSDFVALTLRDNGRGFTPAHVPGPHQGHFGLAGMRERVARLGGTMEIRSELGGGAMIRIVVPRPPGLSTVERGNGNRSFG